MSTYAYIANGDHRGRELLEEKKLPTDSPVIVSAQAALRNGLYRADKVFVRRYYKEIVTHYQKQGVEVVILDYTKRKPPDAVNPDSDTGGPEREQLSDRS